MCVCVCVCVRVRVCVCVRTVARIIVWVCTPALPTKIIPYFNCLYYDQLSKIAPNTLNSVDPLKIPTLNATGSSVLYSLKYHAPALSHESKCQGQFNDLGILKLRLEPL